MPSLAEITQLCRLCLVKDQVNIPIFNGQGDIQQIFHKISTCLPVKISQEDGLPKNICDGCSHKLDMFYQFWNTSSNSEKQLLQWLKEIERSLSLEKDASVQQSHSICPDDDVVLKQEAIDIDEHNADDGIPTDDLNVPTDPDYLLQQSYGSFDYQQEAYNEEAATSNAAGPSSTVTSETAAVAAPKRKRRAAAMKPLPPQINSEDEDDPDAVETKIAKTEKLSDDEDESNPEPTTFVGLPTDNEQPGPSGVDKVTGEAPLCSEGEPQLMPVSQGLSETCFICSKKVKKLKQHMTTHSTIRPYACDICTKTFKSKYTLTSHKRVHSSVKKEPVEQENQKSDTFVQLKKGFTCSVCMEDFTKLVDLRAHVLENHKNSMYMCEICGQHYLTNKSLQDHVQRSHINNWKKYQCEVCGKNLSNPSSLRKHIKTHRGKNGTHMCNTCGKDLSSSTNLKIHMLIHEGLKAHKCETCGKSFTLKATLDAHMRVHTGAKPFQCKVCSQAFAQRAALICHERLHSGERPYKCKLCQKGFVSGGLLNLHNRKKHQIFKCDTPLIKD